MTAQIIPCTVCRTLDWLPHYEISSDGHVRRRTSARNWPAGRLVKPFINAKGYAQVSLVVNGRKRMLRVSRLVCEAFNGPPPSDRHQAAHRDGNPANNQWWNLRWATAKENLSDRYVHGTAPVGERNPQAKLDWPTVRRIRSEYRGEFGQITQMARQLGCDKGVIWRIVHRRSWKECA